jgi:hypothetical protein
LPYLKPQVR